jgi:SAM-dependent methyltransferase
VAQPADCPLCGAPLAPTRVSARDRLVTGDGPFRVWECRECRFGVVRVTELARYYGGAYFETFYGHDRSAPLTAMEQLRSRYREWAAARRFRRVPLGVEGLAVGRVLDVGCGGGELLAHYASLGWEAFGVDLSEEAASAARRRGVSVHVGTLEDGPWEPGGFDLVVFSHSLEHIPGPLEAIRAARGLLKPGGRLVILAPNWRSWQRFAFRSFWFPLDLPRHINHFSVRALERAARRLELETVAVGTSSTIIAVTYSVHYLLAGRWTPGWKLWLAYALGLASYPVVLLIDRVLGGDACYAVLRRPVTTL